EYRGESDAYLRSSTENDQGQTSETGHQHIGIFAAAAGPQRDGWLAGTQHGGRVVYASDLSHDVAAGGRPVVDQAKNQTGTCARLRGHGDDGGRIPQALLGPELLLDGSEDGAVAVRPTGVIPAVAKLPVALQGTVHQFLDTRIDLGLDN